MNRPYLQKDIAELQRLFAWHRDDVAVLQDLLAELGHRRAGSARNLMSQILSRIDEIEPESESDRENGEPEIRYTHDWGTWGFRGEYGKQTVSSKSQIANETANKVQAPRATTGSIRTSTPQHYELFGSETEAYGPIPDDRERPDRLALIRPPGTRGLPDAYVRPLKREVALNLPPDADLPDRFIAALQELVREIKKTGAGQRRYELEKGHRAEAAGGEVLYSFPFADEAELFEDAQVEVHLEGRRVEGTVVSIGGGRLVLALKEEIGTEVRFAVLLIDATALLEALREKIESAKKSEITLNRTLADAVVGKGPWPARPDDPIRTDRELDLNESQRRAHEHVLTEALTFVLGPPGCGKTRTLGEIVRSGFENNKRVLICSNTNKAVDQVLYRVCEAFGRDHPAMEEGKVVRLGRVADDKLASEYPEYVTVDGIVERRSVGLKAEKRWIESQIAGIDARTEHAGRILVQFEALGLAERELATEQANVNELARMGKALQEELSHNSTCRDELDAELQRRRTAIFGFFHRSEDAIQADIQRTATERQGIAMRISDLKERYTAARQRFEQARRTRDSRRSKVADKDRAGAEAVIAQTKDKRDKLVAQLREVEGKIAELRDSVLRDARIVGATCTKAYLSQKDIGQVDLVIIDEASMVILPVAWFSAGLARERVVISGDFRQIPPIVTTEQEAIFTEQEAIFEVLGLDPFTAAGLANLDDPRVMFLDTQHRMRAEIWELISGPMYDHRVLTAAESEPKPRRVPPMPFENPLTIIDTSDLWPFESRNVFFSRFNMLHALLVRNLAWHFRQAGVIESNHDMGVCTPYAAQARMIQKLLEGEDLDRFVQASTVHRYQGDERRIMLLEIPECHGGSWALGQFVQGLPPNHVGARLINVAVSRAQENFVVVANLTYLDKRLPAASLLREILHKMQERGRIVSGREVLKLRPIKSDLGGLIGQMAFDEMVDSMGIFDEAQFERAIAHDIQCAKQSIVLFSGYVTPARVGKLGDLLRAKILDGVKVRCVTRPPKLNGSIPEAAGREAVEMLEGIGAVVDFRAKIHQKVCLIDNRIVWWGSLNVLSHMYHSDETMTRAVNDGFARVVAAHMSKRPISAEKAVAAIAEAENPRCPSCGAHTVLDEGRYGPFLYCEGLCGWRRSIKEERRRTRADGRRKGNEEASDLPQKGPPCPKCGGETRQRQGRFGSFYGCVRYPECQGTAEMPTTARARKGKTSRRSGTSKARK
jgi:ssDNA-binding Zn-finger/Zn-ribbon topoisomerase 1